MISQSGRPSSTPTSTCVDEVVSTAAEQLNRGLPTLAIFAAVSPLLGLLGTVTGMIFAFQQVASTQGSAGAGELAEGIYQALVTTVGGLIVAIPALAVYAVCRNRVDSLIAEGAGNANVLAGGISTALITTAAGLSVAIPALMFHRFFLRRVDELIVDVETEASKLVDMLHGQSE